MTTADNSITGQKKVGAAKKYQTNPAAFFELEIMKNTAFASTMYDALSDGIAYRIGQLYENQDNVVQAIKYINMLRLIKMRAAKMPEMDLKDLAYPN